MERLYAGIKSSAALMTDGYEVYGGIAQANGLTHLGCWAHCRRYFVEAEAVIPKAARSPEQLATRFITAIGELYAIEALARDLAPKQRLALRQAHSKPILAKILATSHHSLRNRGPSLDQRYPTSSLLHPHPSSAWPAPPLAEVAVTELPAQHQCGLPLLHV